MKRKSTVQSLWIPGCNRPNPFGFLLRFRLPSDRFCFFWLMLCSFGRCGRGLCRRLRMAGSMWFILTCSGTATSLPPAMYVMQSFFFYYFSLFLVPFHKIFLRFLSSLCWFCQYNFEGRYDVVRFIKTVQQAGLYVHLRIGPYACAEWNFGCLSAWSSFYLWLFFHIGYLWFFPSDLFWILVLFLLPIFP